MKLNKQYWENRYTNNDFPWDAGEITIPLKTYFNQLENKNIKILIPGCGNAHEAEYLHNNGFNNVFLVDFSKTALKNFKNRIVGFPKEHLICDDFFNLNDKFDLIVEQTFFCAIDKKLRSNYAKHCAQLLTPKGKLVGLLFNDPLYEDHPPYGGNKEEYLQYFKPYFNINVFENAHNSIAPRSNRELFINLSLK